MTGLGNILVVQTAFAGDVILASPMAEAIHRISSVGRIDYLVTPETTVLLKNNPFIHTILSYDKRGSEGGISGFIRWKRRLQQAMYDIAFIPHRSLRSALLVRCAAIPRRVGFDKSAASGLFTDIVPYTRNIHEVDRNGMLLEVLGSVDCMPPPRLYPGHEEYEAVDDFLYGSGISRGERFITLAPGSVWATKRWLPSGFAAVGKALWHENHVPSILVGGPGDRELSTDIRREGGEGFFDATGALSLLASAELIRRSQCLVSNDSAPLHLGVAVGKPVVALFGPTVPAFGFFPYGEGHVLIQRDLECRPCGIHGGRRCPEHHFRCMKEITPDEVLQAVRGCLGLLPNQ